MAYNGLNTVEDYILGVIDNMYRHKSINQALARMKKKDRHTIVQVVKSTSEFSLQCRAHKYFTEVFKDMPVVFRAVENSIPLGGYEVKGDEITCLKEFKQRVNEDIRAAQGKMISKGCMISDPDYQVMWRTEDGQLVAINIEFKKKGAHSREDQKHRQQVIAKAVLVPTEEVDTFDDVLAIIKKYDIPVRIAQLF